MSKIKKKHVGGQAVIEGVMMRSAEYVSVAVRKPNGQIVLKRDPYHSLAKKIKILGWPFFRGGIILIESMVLGIKALNFSADVAITEEDKKEAKKNPPKKAKAGNTKGSNWMMTGTVILALGLGIGLFFYLPLILTDLTGVKSGILFNLVDGGFRLLFFLVYLFLISLWKEIRRIFEYHGAEHKAIFAYEKEQPLTVQGVRSFTTHHPRCGTSFLLVVMLVSLCVFMILGRPETIQDRLIRFLFIPVIGGISYEIIRLADKKIGRFIAKTLVAPGLWLQRITTREPDDTQLEVALVALKSALDMDIRNDVELYSSS